MCTLSSYSVGYIDTHRLPHQLFPLNVGFCTAFFLFSGMDLHEFASLLAIYDTAIGSKKKRETGKLKISPTLEIDAAPT